MLGEFACMEVKDVSDRAGAFLDWGLPKDLLLPFREQGKPVRIGQKVVVAVCMDERTNRIIASARVDKHFGDGMPPYKAGEQVEALVFARTPLGFNAVVGNAYRGLLYFQHGGKDQRASGLSYGQRVKCFVTAVREDRKVDLSLDASGYQRVAPLTEQVMAALTAAGGTLAVDDDTPPELIRASFGASKKAFKQALGALFKAKRIEFTKPGIRATK
jgi:predicted RNA-binding protein (virulence factor B family)